MNKTENTLYILQNLSITESKDLDYAEIDVYYEDEQGNEGATQYNMPAIADDAISTINELQSKIAELEKERDGLALTFKREFTALCSMYIKLSNNVLSGEYANNTPEGSIYNEKIWIDNRWLDITDPLFTSYFEVLEAHNLEQQAKALQFALENITNPDLLYSTLVKLKEQVK